MVSVKTVMAVWTPLTVVPKSRGNAADGHVHRRASETTQELCHHKRQERPLTAAPAAGADPARFLVCSTSIPPHSLYVVNVDWTDGVAIEIWL